MGQDPGPGDPAVVVELDGDLGVPFDPGHGLDDDLAGHGLGLRSGAEAGAVGGVRHASLQQLVERVVDEVGRRWQPEQPSGQTVASRGRLMAPRPPSGARVHRTQRLWATANRGTAGVDPDLGVDRRQLEVGEPKAAAESWSTPGWRPRRRMSCWP
jgi:hypothetical protein